MTSINEAVEAQTGLIKMHDLSINDLQLETRSSTETITQSLRNLEEKVTRVDSELAAKADDLGMHYSFMWISLHMVVEFHSISGEIQ